MLSLFSKTFRHNSIATSAIRNFSTNQAIRFTVTDTSGEHFKVEAKEGDNLMTVAMRGGA